MVRPRVRSRPRVRGRVRLGPRARVRVKNTAKGWEKAGIYSLATVARCPSSGLDTSKGCLLYTSDAADE